MTEELKKQGIADDAAVAETVEETVAAPGLDEAAKAERMRDVDDEDEDETPRDTWATVRRLWSEAAGDHWRFYIVFASIVFYVIFNTAAPAYSARVIDELWGHMKLAFANNATFSITWENCGRTIFIYSRRGRQPCDQRLRQDVREHAARLAAASGVDRHRGGRRERDVRV